MAANHQPDIMAFVKYEHQVFVASLNPYDGYEQWIKVLSGLAPGPVEVVLMRDKTVSDRSQGIAIVDAQSYREAMKVVEKARKTNEVLRIVLYPIEATEQPKVATPTEVATPTVTAVPNKSHIPLQRLGPASTSKVVSTKDMARALETKLEIAESVGQNTTPQWAAEMKKDLQNLIEERFQDLHKSFDRQLSLLGSQMKESMLLSQNAMSMSFRPTVEMTSSTTSGATADSSLFLGTPQQKGVASDFDHLSEYSGSGRVAVAVAYPEVAVPVPPSHVAVVPLEVTEDVSDAGESVVLVSRPDSSNIDVELLEVDGDGQTVGQQSDSVEMVTAEQIQQGDDVISDSGSVVYVETDDEEEDAFSNLRSWAADGALTSSQTTYSKMVDSYNESLQSSFHSVISERPEEKTPPVQETIVYKAWPLAEGEKTLSPATPNAPNAPITLTTPTDLTTPTTPTVGGGDVEDGQGTERPVPVNGSAQLPVNLNAMKSVEEQNLFSPNSDIGTMLLSAASSIANGFLQSMESLSKTLNEYENRRLSQQNSHAPSVAPSETSRTSEVQMESVVEPETVTVLAQEEEEEEEAPVVPPRSRGPRGPPPSTGPFMSWEQITWYCNEYGVPDLIKEPWVNDRVTMEEFNARIVQHFDQLE